VGDFFGYSVSVSDNTAVVGAQYHNSQQGAAYVFVESGGTWSQRSELIASDGAANDNFGSSVSVSGNTILVAAANKTVNGNFSQGAAYVFVESDGTWNQGAELTGGDGAASDLFGSSASLSGNTILVGASTKTVNGNAYQGAAYVFVESGGTWNQEAELTATDGAADDNFGFSVSLNGNTILVGAIAKMVNGNYNQGVAYVFRGGINVHTSTATLPRHRGCAPFPAGYVPFTSVDYVTSADGAGDRLLVGSMLGAGSNPYANYVQMTGLPLPTEVNEVFCGTVTLASGYSVIAYVPTAAERDGDFSAFSGLLIDPNSQAPFPGGYIPVSDFPDPFAWRIAAVEGAP
jgi:hypothetical protein